MRVCSLCQRCYDDSVDSCNEGCHSDLLETRIGSPEMIPGYRLQCLFESSGTGDTYRASRIDCGQSCLIRILSVNPSNVEQVLREARLAAAFFHPNLVDIYEAGTVESDKIFVVSEEPDGQTLREVLNNVGVPELLTSVEVVRQVAEALHSIHLKGLTHRAVRPENIILTTDVEHRLLVRIKDFDFGGVIEKSIVSNKFLIDSALDSLKYFAPELFDGENATAKSDVYSLGIVFYEMLSGTPPFDAAKAAGLIEKHKNQPPPDIKIDNFDLRMLVTHAVMESLTKKPERRQASANAFARQLRHIEQLATHVSTPPPAGIVPSEPARSAPRVTVAIDSATSATIEPVVVMEHPIAPDHIARIETEPVAAFEAEREPTIGIEIRDNLTVNAPIGTFVPVIENFVEIEKIAPVSRRSRLKLHRKRPHQKTAPVQIPHVVAEITTVKPEEIAVAALPRTPTKIAWEQPEEDIPSVADVMEVLASENIQVAPVLEKEPEPIENILPRKSDSGRSGDMSLAPQSPEILSAEITETTVVEEEPEEITIVRAPSRRIKIEWEQPAAVQGFLRHESFSSPAADEYNFFPTILGDTEIRKAIDLYPTDSLLSDYYDSPRTYSYVSRRSVMVGVGVLAMTVLFLFGDDIVGRYASTESPNDSVATTSAGTQPAAFPTASLPVKKASKTSARSLPDSYIADADKPQPMPTKVGLSLSSEKPKTTATKNASNSSVPPTSVRVSNNGKVKTKSQAGKMSAMPTRPRIVEDPRP